MNTEDPKPKILFVRLFRFTFEMECDNKDMHSGKWLKKLEIDYFNKIINAEYYEAFDNGKCLVLDWADTNPSGVGRFSAYDEHGSPLYCYVFDNMKLIGRKSSEFDGSSSEEATHKLSFKYDVHLRAI